MNSNATDPASRLVALDKEGLIAADLPCLTCGYLLRTQSPDGDCPECGASIRDTLESSNLRLLSLDWLKDIQASAICLAIALPTIFFCGIGSFIWALGVILLFLDPPKARPGLKRLGLITGVSAGVATMAILSTFAVEEFYTYDSEIIIAALLGVSGLGLGVHFAGVLRYAAQVCDEAGWPTMNKLSNAFALYGLIWSPLAAAAIALIHKADNHAWNGTTAPTWLEPLLWGIGLSALFSGAVFWLALFVFWIVVAARMFRIRQEALVLHHDIQAPTQ